MFLAPDSHEQEFANAAQAFLGNEFPLRRLHARPRDPRNLKPFAELGWLGLSAPEEVGGVGLSIIEEMLFFLELGQVAGPMEVLSQILAVAVARDDPQLCGALIGGDDNVVLLVENDPVGRIRFIGNADATYAVFINSESASLYGLDGNSCNAVPCLDRSVAMYTGGHTALKPLITVASGTIWQKAQIDVSAMMVGLAQCALDMIVDYARERKTFGRPIGAYQAVRHPCSDMAVRIEAARSQLFYAATTVKEQHADMAMQCDAAKILAERAASMNTDTNIQLHGGIGVTDEHDAHLLLKRANLLARLFGSGKQLRGSLLTLDSGPQE